MQRKTMKDRILVLGLGSKSRLGHTAIQRVSTMLTFLKFSKFFTMNAVMPVPSAATTNGSAQIHPQHAKIHSQKLSKAKIPIGTHTQLLFISNLTLRAKKHCTRAEVRP